MSILKNKRAMIFLGIVLVLVISYAAFANWHDGNGKPMTKQEVDEWISKLQATVNKDTVGLDLPPQVLEKYRQFGYNDDGQPFYMLNLMRRWEKPMYPPGFNDPASTLAEAKHRYVTAIKRILRKNGNYFSVDHGYTDPEAMSAFSTGEIPKYDDFYLIRYKSRRDWFKLTTDSNYADAVVNKFAADKDTVLIPITTGKVMDIKQIALFSTIVLIFLASEIMGGWRKIFAMGIKKEESNKIQA